MKRLLGDVLVVAMLFATTSAFAKTINLHQEPKADSPSTGTINTEAGVTIVYTPKTGEWIKVANPNNGDVGWVKSSDLGGNGYNMRVFTSNDGTHRYSVYKVGTSTGHNQFNQKQIEHAMRHFEQQQRMMQMHMARMFNDMFYFPQPVFVPIVMVPEQQPNSPKKVVSNATPAQPQSIQTAQLNKN